MAQLDYDMTRGLEEWVGGTYRITDDFYRFKLFTDEGQLAMYHLTGKMIPLMTNIKLNAQEFSELREIIWNGSSENLSGLYGPYRVKAFTDDHFYDKRYEDAVATPEELDYEYEWSDL